MLPNTTYLYFCKTSGNFWSSTILGDRLVFSKATIKHESIGQLKKYGINTDDCIIKKTDASPETQIQNFDES